MFFLIISFSVFCVLALFSALSRIIIKDIADHEYWALFAIIAICSMIGLVAQSLHNKTISSSQCEVKNANH
jgi:hypothetical protein